MGRSIGAFLCSEVLAEVQLHWEKQQLKEFAFSNVARSLSEKDRRLKSGPLKNREYALHRQPGEMLRDAMEVIRCIKRGPTKFRNR